jgi:hypothetical protein
MAAVTLLVLAAAAALIACGDDDDAAPTAAPRTATSEQSTPEPTVPGGDEVEPERISVFDLEVGNCFNDDEGLPEETTTVGVVPCGSPHDNEVFFQYELPDGPFPGDDQVRTETFERCDDEFETFVGIPVEDSELSSFPVYPTRQSWADGDRVVYCALYASDLSKLTGSMRGEAR